jgi:hypothetical protein
VEGHFEMIELKGYNSLNTEIDTIERRTSSERKFVKKWRFDSKFLNKLDSSVSTQSTKREASKGFWTEHCIEIDWMPY